MQKLKVSEIKADTNVTITNNMSKEKEVVKDDREYLYSGAMESNPIYVSVRAGSTLNLGDFNSGKIEIGISCPTTGEDLENTFESAKNWLDKRLGKEIQELHEYAEKKKQSKKVDI
jgi:uncharacterized protein (UPF0212 family)